MTVHLPTVQLVFLDGQGCSHAGNILRWLKKRFTFSEWVHISPVDAGIDGVRWVHCVPLDYEDAMRYQAVDMGWLLGPGQSHQLSIEPDGFPVHPECWEHDFLKWDYIGAPWPLKWSGRNGIRVGNGGCCLRSAAFIRVLNTLEYPEGMSGDVFWCKHERTRKNSFGFHKTLPGWKERVCRH